MTDNMKAALFACATMLPILFAVGWLADIITRDVMGMMIISKGGDLSILKEPILGKMWPALLAMWAVASGIVLLLAKAGLGSMHQMPVPPPLPVRANSKTEEPQ